MKSTGIIRKLDELGRIVIPKEIRKKLKIKASDELEIYIENGDNIILKKYFPMSKLLNVIGDMTKIINDITKLECIITDTDTVISSSGKYSRELLNQEITDKLLNITINRKVYDSSISGVINIVKDDDISEYESEIIQPIICESESLGNIILFSKDKKNISEEYRDILRLCSLIISSQLEI